MVTDEQRGEVRSYLRAQSAKLSTDELLAKRAAELEALLASAAGLSDDEARWAPAGEWSAVQILQHVLESFALYREAILRLTGEHRDGGAPVTLPAATVAALSGAIRSEMVKSQAVVRVVADVPADRTEASDFGDLNWREWALFERVHVRDHVTQLRALKDGLDTPGR